MFTRKGRVVAFRRKELRNLMHCRSKRHRFRHLQRRPDGVQVSPAGSETTESAGEPWSSALVPDSGIFKFGRGLKFGSEGAVH
jgi:hypothetical protein